MLLTSLGVSILYAFLYRLAVISNWNKWFKQKKVLLAMALFQVCYGAPMPAIYLCNRPDESAITAYIMQV